MCGAGYHLAGQSARERGPIGPKTRGTPVAQEPPGCDAGCSSVPSWRSHVPAHMPPTGSSHSRVSSPASWQAPPTRATRRRPQATIVFDRHGKPAFTYFVEQRISVPLDRVSPHMVDAILAVEDRRFYQHFGIDPVRIVGAAWRNLRAGRIVEGGSTITQQLARAAQLSPVRTYERKIREILVAARLEERYTKRRSSRNTSTPSISARATTASRRRRAATSASRPPISTPADAALLAALVRSPSTDAPCVVARARARSAATWCCALMQRAGPPVGRRAARGVATSVPDASHEASGASRSPRRRHRPVLPGRSPASAVPACSAPTACCAAGCASTRPTIRSCSARPSGRSRRGSRRLPSVAQGRAGPAGQPGRDESADRRRATRWSADAISTRAASTARRRRAARPARRSSRSSTRRRSSAATRRGRCCAISTRRSNGDGERGCRAASTSETEYTLRRALKVSSNRAAAQLLQQVGVTTAVYYAQRLGIDVAAADGAVAGARHRRGDAARADRGLQRLRATRGSVAAPRLLLRVEDAEGTVIWTAPTSITSRRSARRPPT